MVNEEDMKKALNALDRQLIRNYVETGKTYGIDRTTLMRRHKGASTSRAEATSLHHKCLIDTQEEAIISQINKLTARRLPPTTHIVRNFAEEMIWARGKQELDGLFCRAPLLPSQEPLFT